MSGTEITHLPEPFLEKMKALLKDDFDLYLESYKKPAFHGLRLNSLKISVSDFQKCCPNRFLPAKDRLKKIPWIPNGFYYDEKGNEGNPAKHPYYFAGLYYLQEPSAMTPASLLPVEPGDFVLDLCAAPGGKSTELAAKLSGKGFLLSNDISNSRAKALLKNLELFGVSNACVSSETPEKLSRYFAEFFDKILIDAPCSGEGMFRRDRDMIKSWQEKGPDYYNPIQRSIADEAVQMLKPGGMLLYSTCTFDREEDEGTISYLLSRYPELELLNLEQEAGFEPGIGFPGCVRLFPHKIDGEGHFIALLQKRGYRETVFHSHSIKSNLTKEAKIVLDEFLTHINRDFSQNLLYMKNDSLYYLPEALLCGDPDKLLKVRYLRTGLLLGELKRGRFEPSQALAMNLKKDEFDDTLDFSCEDERVIRYLKGETLSLSAEEAAVKEKNKNGWCLICVDGYPLGFAKRRGISLKNKYYPGWRWQ